jgi:hypothetical protein
LLPAEEDLGVFRGSFSAALPYHDVAVLRITPLEGPLDDSWRPWHGQPIYAPLPSNLAVPNAAAWIEGYAAPGSAQRPAAAPRGSITVSSAKGPPSFAVWLSGLAAVAAAGVVGYFVLLHWRLRGWQQLDDGEGARKLAELSQQRRPSPRDLNDI